MVDVLRYAAFTRDPNGGNPAGVVLDAAGLTADRMLAIAAEVGYSETAFLFPSDAEDRDLGVRYFAPEQEVPFCGHVTIASGVALAERRGVGRFLLHSAAGDIVVETADEGDGITATLTTVPPRVGPVTDAVLDEALAALDWQRDDLDPSFPPAIAYAGAQHLVLVTETRDRLRRLDYDFATMAALMRREDLTTLQLIWPEGPDRFQSRNPFAGGGVVEDPVTGAAAAAFGAYLRHLGRIGADADFVIVQGVDLGRPGVIQVRLRQDLAGVQVSGTAVPIG